MQDRNRKLVTTRTIAYSMLFALKMAVEKSDEFDNYD